LKIIKLCHFCSTIYWCTFYRG